MSTILDPVTKLPLPLVLAFAAGTFTVPVGSQLNVKAAGGAVTAKAPAPAVQGQTFAVVDADGSAAAHPITVDGNGALIDGAATVAINVNNDAAVFVFDAGQWREVIQTRSIDLGAPVRGAAVVEYIGTLLGALRALVVSVAGKANAASPSFTGPATWTGTNFSVFAVPAETQTVAGGTAPIASIAIADETSVTIDFIGSCKGAPTVDRGGTFKGSVTYTRTSGGAPELVGAAVYATPQVTIAGDDMTFGAPVANAVPLNTVAFDAVHTNWSVEIRVAVQAATP